MLRRGQPPYQHISTLYVQMPCNYIKKTTILNARLLTIRAVGTSSVTTNRFHNHSLGGAAHIKPWRLPNYAIHTFMSQNRRNANVCAICSGQKQERPDKPWAAASAIGTKTGNGTWTNTQPGATTLPHKRLPCRKLRHANALNTKQHAQLRGNFVKATLGHWKPETSRRQTDQRRTNDGHGLPPRNSRP